MKNGINRQLLLCALALSSAGLFAAGESTTKKPNAASCAPKVIPQELMPLQGDWVGEGAGGKCSITISGNSLHYRHASGWYKTTFTLPAGTNPKQLHATILECSPPSKDAIGQVVFAIFKIENGTLTLADGAEKAPESFETAMTTYTLKKAPILDTEPLF